jgi:tetratricopeptide (TPR) repeat protein
LICAVLYATPLIALPRAKEIWIRVETANFTLFSNAGSRRTLEIGEQLEGLREVLARTTRGMQIHSPLPTRIYVFRNAASFRPYKLNPDGKPSNVDGYFVKADAGNYVAIDASAAADPYGVIFHEYLHYFVGNNLPNLPLWLNEGLAEFYSTFRLEDNRAELGHPIPHHLTWFSGHRMFTMEELFATTPASETYVQHGPQQTFYAQAWALTHYMLTGKHREQFSGLLGEFDRGATPQRAFQSTMGVDYETLAKRLRTYVRRGVFEYFVFEFEQPVVPPDATLVRGMDRAEVLCRLGDLLSHTPPIRRDAAERHFQEAIRLDPTLSEAYSGLGTLRELAHRGDEAGALYEKAIDLDPEDAYAYWLLGRFKFNAFVESLSGQKVHFQTTPPELLEARALLRKSIELGAGVMESYAAFGRTFLFENHELEDGIAALRRVAEQMPSRDDVLYDLLVLYVNRGDEQAARSILDDALRLRAAPELVERAEDQLLELEHRKADRLLELGDVREAKRLLRSIAERANQSTVRRSALARLAGLDATAAGSEVMAIYNAGVEAANNGDLDRGIELLERAQRLTRDDALRIAATEQLTSLRELSRYNKLVRRYNDAIATANRGDVRRAIAMLELLLELEPDDRLRPRVESTLAELREAVSP